MARKLLCKVAMGYAHASTNAVHGSLHDTSLEHLLQCCRDRLVTGKIEVKTPAGPGHIELRAGMIEHAELTGHTSDIALERLLALREGSYVVVQRLPDLGGDLGTAAEFRGDVDALSLVAVMRHCEQNALTCTITIINDFDRAELVYQAGEIVRVLFNGQPDDERIVDIVRFDNARFRVSAPPLELAHGKPVMRRAPTEPFTIAHLRDHFEPVAPDQQLDAPAPWRAETAPPPPVKQTWSKLLRLRIARALRSLSEWLESERLDSPLDRWHRITGERK